jgi:F-type H+-transporting ATPase subunit b
MDLLNQTLNGFSEHISDLPISINPDILETNLLIISLLLGGVIYLGNNVLTASLAERQQKILGAIQESDERLQEAVTRLTESEKQLAQAQIVIESIKEDAKKTAQQVKAGILNDGKTEIERLTSTAKSQITTIEAKIRKQITDYVVALALKRVTVQLEGKLKSNLQQQIIDRNISKLGD